MSRTDVAQAVREGAQSAARGDRATVCPYGRGNILRTAWVRGYTRARAEKTTAAE